MLLITEDQSSLLAQKSPTYLLIRSSEYLFTRHPTTPIFSACPFELFKVSIAYALFSRWLYKSAGIDYSDIGRLMSSTSTCPARSSSPARHSLSTLFFAHPRLRQYIFICKGARFFAYRLIEHIQAESLFGKSGGYSQAIFILA